MSSLPPPEGLPSSDFAPPTSPVTLDDSMDLPVVVGEPYVQARQPRRFGRLLAASVAVVALGTAGAFAVVQARSDTGGASSPEAAVDTLLAAVSDGDLLGMMDALDPSERDVLRQPMTDMITELKRIGVVSDTMSMSKVPGLTITFSDLQYGKEALSDDVTSVTITGGSMRAQGDWSTAPLGESLVSELLDGKRPTGTMDETQPITGGPSLVVVSRDGKWYVSLFYSIAEAARADAGMEAPAFGAGVAAVGADSPEGAVRAMIDALTTLDVRRMVELTPPGEMAALHDYAPLFLDDAESAVADLKARAPFSVTIGALDLTSSGSGSRRSVGIGDFDVTAEADGTKVHVTRTGKCFTFESPDKSDGSSTQKVCLDDPKGQLDGLGLSALADLPQSGISVVEEGGRWYVSPTRTVLDSMVTVLRAVDDTVLSSLTELLTGFGSALGGESASGAMIEPTVTSEFVPLNEAYPECVGDFFSTGFDLTDAEFVAAVHRIHDCLAPDIASGKIDPMMADPMLMHPDCVTVNIYRFEASTTDSDAFWACVAAQQ